MALYHGIVKGNTVVLPPDAALADGSVVEVSLAQSPAAAASADVADQQVQAALVAAGLLHRIQPPHGSRSDDQERPLLRIAGPPVSETVIVERR